MLDFSQCDFGQFDFGQLAEIELAEIEIGRSRNWPKSKLAEVEIGRTRNWPKSKLIGRSRTDGVCSVSSFSLSFFLFFHLFLFLFLFLLLLLILLTHLTLHLVFVLFLFSSTRPGRRGSHTTARELQTCTFHGPGASNTTKIPRKDPNRERRKKIVAGKGKKSAKFWAPHPSGLHPAGLHPSGLHPSWLHPSGPHFF